MLSSLSVTTIAASVSDFDSDSVSFSVFFSLSGAIYENRQSITYCLAAHDSGTYERKNEREKAVPEGRGNRAPRDRAGRSPERMKEILDRGDPRLRMQHQQHYHRGISVSVRRIAKLDRIDK